MTTLEERWKTLGILILPTLQYYVQSTPPLFENGYICQTYLKQKENIKIDFVLYFNER